jgi:hypothetical protein
MKGLFSDGRVSWTVCKCHLPFITFVSPLSLQRLGLGISVSRKDAIGQGAKLHSVQLTKCMLVCLRLIAEFFFSKGTWGLKALIQDGIYVSTVVLCSS